VPVHAVSGATGFVGRALVLELLTTTAADIACLVRPSSRPGQTGTRLVSALTDAARAYGYPEAIGSAIARRCRLVPADLHQPLAAALRVDQVWHCAGSLRYHERDRQLIDRTNVDGTAHLLQFAADAGATGFHYVSTAYVAGTRDGLIRENRARLDTTQNAYEKSKVRAEDLVLSTTAFRTTVLRPSVVIGHSRTAAVSGNLSGVYSLGLSLARHAREPGGIRMHIDPRASANLVPIDQVAAEAVACGHAGRWREIFHLVGWPTVPVRTLLQEICRALGVGPVTFVDRAADLRDSDRRLADRMAYYLSYMRGDKVFDRTNTDRVVGAAADRYAGRPALEDLWRWYTERFPSHVTAGAR
jgi:nucleoside-diphosphate-sugar epimerase